MTIVIPGWILWAVCAWLVVKVALDITKLVLEKQTVDRAWSAAKRTSGDASPFQKEQQ